MSAMDLQGVISGTQESRVEALRRILDYPLKQYDPEGSRFWFLRPGADEDEAEDTCPIAVGFYSELNHLSKDEILQFFTSDAQQNEIYGHYTKRIMPNQPVMYLLLPETPLTPSPSPKTGEGGRIAMILPTDGKLRQRQIQTFSWSDEDLQARLNRLRQDTLARTNRMKDAALSVIPLVEWAFYKPITTAKELAQKLAEVSRRIERVIPDVYRAESNDGYLRGLLRSFQKELLPTLKLEPENEKDYSFADIYAQTIAYGLFTARVFSYTIDERRNALTPDPSPKGGEGSRETDFNREDAWELLPETNPFLRRLFRDVSKAVGEYAPSTELRGAATALRSEKSDESPVIADELIDAISEVVSILRAAKMDAILEDFRAKMNREDIVIRFYEDFLAAYKPQMRERRGVYYTPEPVVSYMVRSVDILLKEKFNKPLGLADPEVMILDPACGTGTFLLWIFQLIHQRFQENPDALTEGLEDRSWSGYVKERLLPRIFGFELLMAPYAIAHLKLGLFLEETGYQFDGGKRLGIFLTNSLDDSIRKSQTLFEEFIAEESDQASLVKLDKPIMIVIGNPPYEGESANKNIAWINRLVKGHDPGSRNKVENYFEVDGQSLRDLGERNTKWLNNDYVKFIRFAHWRIEKTDHGIIALITDRSFLGGSTFRGMRQSLLSSFDSIRILDLHGNVRGRRKGSLIRDENVFQISQGTAISFLVKSSTTSSQLGSFLHADLWGRWEEFTDICKQDLTNTCKAGWLLENHVGTTGWLETSATSPYYSFERIDGSNSEDTLDSLQIEYQGGWKITEIFDVQSMGITSGLDKSRICAQYSSEEMWALVEKFANTPIEDAKFEFGIDKDTKIFSAQNDIRENGLDRNKITPILYRPFDVRFTYYTGKSEGFHYRPRKDVMRNLIKRNNIALCFIRSSRESIVSNFFVSNYITDKTVLSSSDNANVTPLYIYPDVDAPEQLQEITRHNLSQGLLSTLASDLGFSPSPEDIFYYIYAILYCPAYRRRYISFLKIDFPYIPFTKSSQVFRQLSSYGKELVSLHLMTSPKLSNLITHFESNGNPMIDAGHPKYADGKVILNKKGESFTGVPEEVWNFYVGGYQVCQKWLKDRKGRTLSPEDITHYQRIVVALQETIRLMQQIDAAIPGWPLE
jgi:type I restriction-modification system DNA methylase subunit